MRHDADSAEETPGGDSFLDIVANIVGILVLLVVVVGVRAGRAVITPDERQPAQVAEGESAEDLNRQLAEITRKANQTAAEALETKEKVAATLVEANRREEERAEATLYITKLRAELDEAREALDSNDQQSLDLHNAISQAQLKLERMTHEQIALASVEPDPELEEVVVSPTPIVDGRADKTISFRLQKDRLVYVPVSEIEVQLMKDIEVPAITDPSRRVVSRQTIGPIAGFVGEADIAWSIRASGNRVGVRPQLGKLILKEVTPLRGETTDEAFNPGGYVVSRLELMDPQETVVRLIVYADSFETAPDACAKFRQRGYRVAQSLKSNGQPIGFASDGFKTVTQ